MVITRRNTQDLVNLLRNFHSTYAIFFLSGLAAVYLQPVLPDFGWFLLPLLLALVLYRLNTGLSVGLLIFTAAALLMWLHAYQILNAQWPESRHGEDIWTSGQITEVTVQNHKLSRFLFKPDQLDGLVRVAWYRNSINVQEGECWKFKLRMRAPRGSINPGGFDYEGWLFRQGIVASAYVREYKQCDATSMLAFKLPQWRDSVIQKVSLALDGHAMKAAVLALALGSRQDFGPDDWALLRHTGTSHLMAISGLHIGIVALWLYWLGSVLWRFLPYVPDWLTAKKSGLIFSAVGACGYAVMSGMGLPAQRALIMLLIVYVALWQGRRVSAIQVLSIALVIILLLQPFAIAEAGFWLSFAAVFWIYYLLSYRWQVKQKIPRLLYLQLSLGLALMPLVLFWFSEVSWISPAVNLVLVPVFSLLVPALLGAVLWLVAHEDSGAWLLESIADLLGWIWTGLRWIDANIAGSYPLVLENGWLLLLATIAVIWLCAPHGWPARWLGLLLLLPILSQSELKTDNMLRLVVLDVGQGLSVAVETDNKVLIYDAGPAFDGGFDAGDMVVLPYLKHRGYKKVDMLVQSHTDLDHRGGIGAITNTLPVLRSYGVQANKPCRQGDYWTWGSVSFDFLHPDNGSWKGNNSSCVLKITAGNHVVLLTGDIEAPVENRLLNVYGQAVKANVLVAPHHGSKSSSTIAFARAVNPEIVIFSMGWKNRWGFPHDEVKDRYTINGAALYSTAEHGAIIIDLPIDGDLQPPVLWREASGFLWRSGF